MQKPADIDRQKERGKEKQEDKTGAGASRE